MACPENLNHKERRALRFKFAKYRLINLLLLWIKYDGVLLICLEQEEDELQDSPARGHFARNTTAHKILRLSYYWPTLFKDAHTHARNCNTCQLSVRKEKRATIPLHPVNVSRPFEQWGLDIIE